VAFACLQAAICSHELKSVTALDPNSTFLVSVLSHFGKYQSRVVVGRNVMRGLLESLDLRVNRVVMKLFKTSIMEIINECRNLFGMELTSVHCTTG